MTGMQHKVQTARATKKAGKQSKHNQTDKIDIRQYIIYTERNSNKITSNEWQCIEVLNDFFAS